MVCNSCGREASNEQSNFCMYCGASHTNNIEQHKSSSQHNSSFITNTVQYSNNDDMSYMKWLGTLLLPQVPIVGGLVYIVLLIIWAVRKDINPSKSNWAKAALLARLIYVISIIIAIFFILVFIGLFIEAASF